MHWRNIKKKRRLSKNELRPSNEKAAIKKWGIAMYLTNKTKISEKIKAMTDVTRQIFRLSKT